MMNNVFDKIDLNNIKGVLIDLDDTLYSYEECNKIAYEKCKELAFKKYKINSIDFDNFLKSSRKKINETLIHQAASHSRLLYFHILHESIFGTSNPAFALEMEENYWNTFLENMKLYEECKLFLKKLKDKSITSCIVTDLTTQIQMKKWIKLELDSYINFLVTSEEAGVEKPDAKIFEIALNKLNLKANEVIMIGDNPNKDIEGAEKIGIKSYLIK